jgi:FMN phosphatase YigB (HAD superfamily)
LGVEASQAVFVDDMLQNIEGAEQVGLRAIYFRNPTQMRRDLESLLNGNYG